MEALVLVAVAGGVIAGVIADARGHSFAGYFIVGMLLPVLGILLAALAPAPTPASKLGQLSPATGEGWWPDPTGRFENRYYNGKGWTKHVARAGTGFEDPL